MHQLDTGATYARALSAEDVEDVGCPLCGANEAFRLHYSDETLWRTLEKVDFRVVRMDIARPVQSPIWYERLGLYLQYPSHWYMDWKRYLGRQLFYYLAVFNWKLTGRIGWFAPNIRALAIRS